MRTYNRYLLSLAIVLSAVNAVLAFAGQKDISVYFICDTIAYLVVTLISVYLNPRARRLLNAASAVMFAGFIVIVALKAVEILAKR